MKGNSVENEEIYDVVVIGAGVTGCAIARELSKYEANIVVIERESDVCEGTSKANSAIIHAGFDAKPGTLKAKFNVLGSKMMSEICKKLDIPFKQNGSMVLCFDDERVNELEELKNRGIKNGVENLEILSRDEAIKIEPALADNVKAVLYAPTGGIICPFHMTIAFAENAADNDVEFRFNEEVINITKESDIYKIETARGVLYTKTVINAAGVYADKLHNMVSKTKLNIVARRGEYCLMDKEAGKLVSHTLFQLPGKYGKGILVTPTVHGNLLVGPTANDIDDKEDVATTSEGLSKVLCEGAKSVSTFPNRQIITSFSGLRAHELGDDFVIGEVHDAKGFIDVAGIESPGLSCAPAIAEHVAEIVKNILNVNIKANYIETRKGIPCMSTASREEQTELIKQDAAFAKVICRCEMVTEGEIKAAINRTLGATTVDGIKRRTRAGLGRCQAGFCNPKVVEILARELGVDIEDIKKSNKNSAFLEGYNKGGAR